MRMMSKRSLLLSVLVVSVALLATPPVGAQRDEQPQATDIGITDDEIRVAVVADVESPLSPGLFQSQVDAVNGVRGLRQRSRWDRGPRSRRRLLRLEAER